MFVWAGGFLSAFLSRILLEYLLDLPTWADIASSLLIGYLFGMYLDFEWELREHRRRNSRG